MVDVLDLKL